MGLVISPVSDRQYFSAKTDRSVPVSHAYFCLPTFSVTLLQYIDEDKWKAVIELERTKRETDKRFQEEKQMAEEAITLQFATDDTKQPLNTAQPTSTSKPANSSNSASTETPSTANTKTGLSLSLTGAADGTVRVSTQSPRTPPTGLTIINPAKYL
ncbi:hypothetical protein BLNAU_22845 [Blattamonas nauphoetae]|uniref:Uncharacterized protein n=1 Tax=Blattamonas nauphoetae TaxID=2049346 RepID=A0ABQ9WSC9_9EUKA|nr:hypothetical protein BLNAU_22845 [Blattamonas nauphoetae]